MRRLNRCEDAESANQIRKRAKRRRIFLVILPFLISSTLFTYFYLRFINDLSIAQFVVTFLWACFFEFIMSQLFLRRTLAIVGNIKPLNFSDVDRSEPYSLFLRGFLSDDPRKDEEFVRIFPKSAFSEVHYIDDIKCGNEAKFYAVGNPKELDSPYGASRIYLDNSCWKEEVGALMDYAKEIHIRVCNTPSCQWEINRAATQLDRVTFIVDDLTAYNTIRQNQEVDLDFPELSDDIGWTFYVLKMITGAGWAVNRLMLFDNGCQLVYENSKVNKPYRQRIQLATIAAILWMAFCIIASAPNPIAWTNWGNEVHEAFSRAEWTIDEWAQMIDGSLPQRIEDNDDYIICHCTAIDGSIVFEIEMTSNDIDSCAYNSICDQILTQTFKNENAAGYEGMFYDKVLASYDPLIFRFRNKDMETAVVSISEEDLIKMRHLKRHITSHMTPEEVTAELAENALNDFIQNGMGGF